MKKGVIWLIKSIIAASIAIFILSVFALLYYNNGIRKTSETGATDYVWENRFHSLGYEGYAWGWYDEFGYNNAYEIGDGEVDILLMGSSHMNAYNVSTKSSTGYLLNELMHSSHLKYNVYNIGMEGHIFYTCSDNLEDALAVYTPRKYVIMETTEVSLSMDQMGQVLSGTRTKSPAYDTGIIYYLQKVPYLRLLNKKFRDIQGIKAAQDKESGIEKVEVTENDENNLSELLYDKELDLYMERLSEIVKEKGVVLILFYLPSVNINDDGSININRDIDDISKFAKAAQNHDIEFVDMSETFMKNYETNYKLPYGFSNTKIGGGHLNRVGHELVANKLYDAIVNLEDE